MTPDEPPYRTTYDWESESLTATVVEAVSELGGIEPTEFRLAEYVDPDALNALFRPRPNGSGRSDGRVDFVVEGYRVVVSADGDVSVRPHDE